ncbi:MAG: hypothetical protein EZS28_056416, partial [Streblomastix strix]
IKDSNTEFKDIIKPYRLLDYSDKQRLLSDERTKKNEQYLLGKQYDNSDENSNPFHNQIPHKLYSHNDRIRKGVSIELSPCGRYAAVYDGLGRVRLIDVQSGILIHSFKGYRRAQIAWLRTKVNSNSEGKQQQSMMMSKRDRMEGRIKTEYIMMLR